MNPNHPSAEVGSRFRDKSFVQHVKAMQFVQFSTWGSTNPMVRVRLILNLKDP
jgi:hypothetical protein